MAWHGIIHSSASSHLNNEQQLAGSPEEEGEEGEEGEEEEVQGD